jgi:hypothetical protein
MYEPGYSLDLWDYSRIKNAVIRTRSETGFMHKGKVDFTYKRSRCR